MTETDYNALRLRLRALFPSLEVWFRELTPTAQDGIRERWRGSLMPLDLVDVEAAVKQLSTQAADPWPYSSDKERVGGIIADRVRQAKAELAAAAKAARMAAKSPDIVVRGTSEFPVGQLFRCVSMRIAQSDRHSLECQEYRARTGRCLPGCGVPKEVADEVLAEWDTCERLEKPFAFEVREVA